MKKAAVKLSGWQKGVVNDDSRFLFLAASRQTGKSFTLALRRVMKALKGRRLGVLLSRGERQSLELMEKVKMHCQIMGAAVESEDGFFEETSILTHTVKFPDGQRIIALPANPDTARGFSGDVDLDEFALHKDSKAIWAALAPVATRGYDIAVASTFKGTANEFYRIGKDLGLHEGVRPERQPVRAAGWSGHWVDIHMAVEQGLKVDIPALRQAIGDEEIWLEEFCNVPMVGADQFVPLELVLGCESETEASIEWDGIGEPEMYAGLDIGRKKDRSVLWILQREGDVLVTRGVVWMERMPFADQLKVARDVAPAVERFAIDATGIGAMLAETLHGEFPWVEQVEFTAPVKERMAVELKKRFEERTLRLPADQRIRRGVSAVKRFVGPTGVMRFDAARTEAGHADEFWSLALANAAAGGAGKYVPASEGGLAGDAVMAGLMGRVF